MSSSSRGSCTTQPEMGLSPQASSTLGQPSRPADMDPSELTCPDSFERASLYSRRNPSSSCNTIVPLTTTRPSCNQASCSPRRHMSHLPMQTSNVPMPTANKVTMCIVFSICRSSS
jgi:hypothetical protein